MKLLVIEDNQSDAEFLAACLRRRGNAEVELTHATTLAEGIDQLGRGRFDVILATRHYVYM